MFENFSNKLIFQALIILDEEEQKCILEITKTIFFVSPQFISFRILPKAQIDPYLELENIADPTTSI